MSMRSIDAATAKQWLDSGKAILVDVREPAEYASRNIPQSTLKPLGSVCCDALPKTDKKIIIHCQKGMRGEKACQKILAEDNSVEIYNLQGGIEAWQQAGLETTSETSRKLLPLNQQVQLTIGLAVLIFSLLAYFVNPAFALVAAFFGAGLTNAGLTGWCGLALLMAKMPWNQKM